MMLIYCIYSGHRRHVFDAAPQRHDYPSKMVRVISHIAYTGCHLISCFPPPVSSDIIVVRYHSDAEEAMFYTRRTHIVSIYGYAYRYGSLTEVFD